MFKKIFSNLFKTEKLVKPIIGIASGSAAKDLSQSFLPLSEVVYLNEEIKKHLKGDYSKIAKMSPRQITQLMQVVVSESMATGYLFPGSINTIPDFLWNEKIKIPKNLDVPFASALVKMALNKEVYSKEMPTLHSCDGSNYPIVLFGGKILPSSMRSVILHDNKSSHPIYVKKQTWLGKSLEEVLSNSAGNNLIVDDVYSTHPMIPSQLPKDLEVLAVASDDSAAIISFTEEKGKNIAIIDHPEAGKPTRTDIIEKNEELEMRLFGEVEKKNNVAQDDCDAMKLWYATRDEFISQSSREPNKNPSSTVSARFNSRVLDILDTKDLTELDKESFIISKGR